MKKYKIDKWAIIITLALVAVFSVYIILMPTAATEILNNIRIFITTKMGVYFIVITIGIFVFNFAVAFSKFGNICRAGRCILQLFPLGRSRLGNLCHWHHSSGLPFLCPQTGGPLTGKRL